MKDGKTILYGLISSSLPFYLAQFMAIEDREVVIISPYISEFPILPVDKRKQSNSTFFTALENLMHMGIKIRVFTTLKYAKKFLDPEARKNKLLTIKISNAVHEKFFITSTFFYEGSANLTYSGLYKKIENCSIGLVSDNSERLKGVVYEIEGASYVYREE